MVVDAKTAKLNFVKISSMEPNCYIKMKALKCKTLGAEITHAYALHYDNIIIP